MDVNTIIANMKKQGQDIVRRKKVFSWGDFDTCKQLFCEIFQSVDTSMTKFEFLPEYNQIIEWMTNTRGRGLLLCGDCGRGKSSILSGVIPVLLYQKTHLTIRAIHSQSFETPCKATWATTLDKPKNIDYLCNCPYPIIDEIGVESQITNYGEKYEGFNRVLNIAEQKLNPVFVSTNLTPEQLLERYDVRTMERLIRLCTMITFKGESKRQ